MHIYNTNGPSNQPPDPIPPPKKKQHVARTPSLERALNLSGVQEGEETPSVGAAATARGGHEDEGRQQQGGDEDDSSTDR